MELRTEIGTGTETETEMEMDTHSNSHKGELKRTLQIDHLWNKGQKWGQRQEQRVMDMETETDTLRGIFRERCGLILHGTKD